MDRNLRGKSLELNEIYNEFNPCILDLVFYRDDQIIKINFPDKFFYPEAEKKLSDTFC